MKVLRPELADNPEFRVRFGREVTMLTRVQGVCTVRVVQAETKAPKPFLHRRRRPAGGTDAAPIPR